jgi:hypothetical protein
LNQIFIPDGVGWPYEIAENRKNRMKPWRRRIFDFMGGIILSGKYIAKIVGALHATPLLYKNMPWHVQKRITISSAGL